MKRLIILTLFTILSFSGICQSSLLMKSYETSLSQLKDGTWKHGEWATKYTDIIITDTSMIVDREEYSLGKYYQTGDEMLIFAHDVRGIPCKIRMVNRKDDNFYINVEYAFRIYSYHLTKRNKDG